jgi:hypothetical protein
MVKNKLISPDWDLEISITQIDGVDYFSLNAMLEIVKDKDKTINDWLRNKGTMDSIGYWEKRFNPNFNYGEFSLIRNNPDTGRFSVKQLTQLNGKSIISRAGRYGGTYAHKDIAMDFAMWLSPEFKFNVIHVYQTYLDAVSGNFKWEMQRLLSKTTLRLLTDAIKNNVVPYDNRPAGVVYATEVDKHNVLAFGERAKDWRAKNPELSLKKLSQRDQADIYSLAILSSLQSYDRALINKGLPIGERQRQLDEMAKDQMQFYFNPETLNDNSPRELEQ